MIAEFNIGRLLHDWEDPRVAPFVRALDRVYALAEAAPGYVWHLPGEEMGRVQDDPDGPLKGDPRIACTLSVWESVEALAIFSLTGVHGAFVQRGPAWFEAWDTPRLVIWQIADGTRPTVAEGVARLDRLTREGAGTHAFDWTYARQHGWLGAEDALAKPA
ncbi:MAG: DUF3291 domain-containing protein [Pseudomonadota bacterium]